MGWGAAANAQNQATQMAMIAQAQQAANAQNALQKGQATAEAAYTPYQTVGVNAINQLAKLYGPTGEYTQMPTFAQLQMDPGYAFREQQGLQAVQRQMAAGGLGGSGAALKGAQRFGQDMASQEYGNAYNRFMANRLAATQALQGLSSTGFNAAQGIGGAATGTAQNLAQNYQNLGQGIGQGYANIGAANASSYMAPTNLLASALEQGAQLAAMYAGGGFGGGSAGMNLASRAMGGGGSPFPQGPGGYNAAMGYMRS